MRVGDIMSRDLVSTTPGTLLPEVAVLMLREHISAIPVLDNGVLVGIVSESDLMHRHELGTERDPVSRPWWMRRFAGEQSPASYVESHAMTVRDVMTATVVSVSEDTAVADVVSLFDTHRLRQLPVVTAGRLVGLIGRADLVRAFASHARAMAPELQMNDESIHRALRAELHSQAWWHSTQSHFRVIGGVVHFHGLVESSQQGNAARVAAENMHGVRGVEIHSTDDAEPTMTDRGPEQGELRCQ